MKYKVFDVIEIKKNNLETIMKIENNKNIVEEINCKGKVKGIKEVTDNNIKELKFSK